MDVVYFSQPQAIDMRQIYITVTIMLGIGVLHQMMRDGAAIWIYIPKMAIGNMIMQDIMDSLFVQ